jgi:hypothetical protein
MTKHDAGNELARLLLPYGRRFSGTRIRPTTRMAGGSLARGTEGFPK